MHYEPSLECVPSLYLLCMQFNTESYVAHFMSTFNATPCSLWSRTLGMGSMLSLQSSWDGFKYQLD